MAIDPFGLPPEEAIRWFREKGYRIGYDWRDIELGTHARAFTVAKATQLDVLADIREAVDKSIASGQTLNDFRKALQPTLAAKGWWGKHEVDELDLDGNKTGKRKLVQLGSANRLRTIYETNLRAAQAAGRWERFQRTKSARPYARYVCLLDGRERAEHRAWHNTVLPIDHPWWSTHAPPNGWGCRCKLQQLSDRDLERYGLKVSAAAPPVQMVAVLNERTRQTMMVPKGIDAGFDYNPGQALRGFVLPPQKRETALSPIRDFRDEGRPTMAKIIAAGRLPPAEPRWYELLDADAELKKDLKAKRITREEWQAKWNRLVGDAGRRWNAMLGGRDTAEVEDPLHQQITFSTRALMHMISSGGIARASYAPRAKQAIEDPVEIWMQPNRRADGSVVMRLVYIGAFEGRSLGASVVVERTESGHALWTAYADDKLDGARTGYLLYSRPTPRPVPQWPAV